MTLDVIKTLLRAQGVATIRAHWIEGTMQTITFWSAENKAVIPMPKLGRDTLYIGALSVDKVAAALEGLPHAPNATMTVTTAPIAAYCTRTYTPQQG